MSGYDDFYEMAEKDGFTFMLDKHDICQSLGISSSTFLRMCNSGELPAVKIGRRWYVERSAFRAMVEDRLANV